MSSTITGTVDLSDIPHDVLDATLELRAAVAYGATVLGSTVLKPGSTKDLSFAVTFEPPFLPGARLPCPVRLLIGPNLSDLELLSLETVAIEVDLAGRQGEGNAPKKEKAKEAEQAKNEIRIAVGAVKVALAVYRCWILCCRLYTIRGRVVCRKWQYDRATRRYRFCDSPVPGATVEVYDVDRWLFWTHRGLIATAVTDIVGNFEIKFRWCCLNWRPWLVKHWAVDPEIFARVKELFEIARVPFPPRPPGPDPDPLFLQEALGGANIARRANLIAPSGVVDAPVSAEALLRVLPASPELAALHVWPWWDQYDCAPDVVFRVTQACDNKLEVIHAETNAQTRWNIPTTIDVTLLANDLACCLPACRDPECPECLLFTLIGCTPINEIGNTPGSPDLRGYGKVATSVDHPFFGDIRIHADMGSDVDYYKVQYSRDGSPFADLPEPAFEGLRRWYWDGLQFMPEPLPAFFPFVKNGETVITSRRHYEVLHPALLRGPDGHIGWRENETIFFFNTYDTGLTPDGLYQLRVVAYSADAADNLILSSARVLPTCSQTNEERVYIRVDNQAAIHAMPTALHPCGGTSTHACTNEPDCFIGRICINEGTPAEHCIAACDIVRLKATDTLTIHFSVTVPMTVQDGHLAGYSLNAEYGVSQFFPIGTGAAGTFLADPTPEVGPTYLQALMQGAPRPHWYGGDYKVTVHGSDFPLCCAYDLRLFAWKRTTNDCIGAENIHNNQFSVSFTVLREELCPNTCPDQR